MNNPHHELEYEMDWAKVELSLIGGILLSENKYVDIADRLKATDFMTNGGLAAWLAISQMYGEQPINIQTVYLKLEDEEHKKWVLSASQKTAIAANVPTLADRMIETSKRARLVGTLHELATRQDLGSEHLLSAIMDIYQKESGNIKQDCSINAVLDRFLEKQAIYKEEGLGLDTGFESFDRDFVTYRPGHLWIIGAWTSTGKTAWMVEAVRRCLGRAKMAIFSTEMVEEQNISRLLANMTGVNANVVLSGRMIDKHIASTNTAITSLRNSNVYVYDQIRTTEGIATQCRKLKLKHDLDVVFIDFIQNLDSNKGKKYDIMSNAAVSLQNLAHELRCTVVCLSQLPNHAGREDSGILEFKGAGEIAAAADVGVLMKRAKEDKKTILFDVRKNRHGACKKYMLKFVKDWTSMEELGEVEC